MCAWPRRPSLAWIADSRNKDVQTEETKAQLLLPQHGRGAERQVAVVHGGCGGAAESWRAQALLHTAKQQLELVENNSPMPFSTPGNSWQLGPDPKHGGRLAGSAFADVGDRNGESNPAAAGRGRFQGDCGRGRSAGFGSQGAGIRRESTSSASQKNTPGISAWALLDAGRPADPGLCRRSGPARCRAAVRKLKAVSAVLPVFIAGCSLSCRASSKPPRCAWDPGWAPWDAQVCPLIYPAHVRERVGCTDPRGVCRPSPCRAPALGLRGAETTQRVLSSSGTPCPGYGRTAVWMHHGA